MKCYKHLPGPEDLEMSILKGHLLAETRMREYISKKLPNPGGCDLDAFKFSQLVQIARGLCASSKHDGLWQSIQRLNILRNRLAHELDDQRFTSALDDFLTYHTNQFLHGHAEHKNIHTCVVNLYANLVHLIDEDTEQSLGGDSGKAAEGLTGAH